MEVQNRRHNYAMPAALALIFLFAMAMGGGFLEILQDKKEPSSWSVRQRLAGPGSSPPICRSRCGSCFPCQPIHVAIQPGQSILLEYYPEAWRCKCRDKLFTP